MNSVTTELDVNITDVESPDDETSVLNLEQLSLIAGGQCTTNSI